MRTSLLLPKEARKNLGRSGRSVEKKRRRFTTPSSATPMSGAAPRSPRDSSVTSPIRERPVTKTVVVRSSQCGESSPAARCPDRAGSRKQNANQRNGSERERTGGARRNGTDDGQVLPSDVGAAGRRAARTRRNRGRRRHVRRARGAVRDSLLEQRLDHFRGGGACERQALAPSTSSTTNSKKKKTTDPLLRRQRSADRGLLRRVRIYYRLPRRLKALIVFAAGRGDDGASLLFGPVAPSRPEALSYLSTEQVLADHAQLLTWLKGELLNATASKVVPRQLRRTRDDLPHAAAVAAGVAVPGRARLLLAVVLAGARRDAVDVVRDGAPRLCRGALRKMLRRARPRGAPRERRPGDEGTSTSGCDIDRVRSVLQRAFLL